MKTLYAHQQRFIDRNPNNALLVWETGTGKTLAACEWLKKREDKEALIVCPKAIMGKWKRDLEEEGVAADIMSRDEIKKLPIKDYRAIVLDEAQDYASPLFNKARSQRTTVIYNHIKDTKKETHVLLLTATPIRSTPWNIHTLACYMGVYWNSRDFQNKFWYLTDMYGRMHYELKNGWQKMIKPYVEEIADIVLMKDCVDVPKQESQILRLKEPEMPPDESYLEPSAKWYARHRNEQGAGKLEALKKITDGYRKVIVVCHYTEQIERYAKELGKERLVYVLQGATKDPDKEITEAKDADDCIFIIQASMGAGFDAAEFSVVIFASMSFRYVDYIQMLGRVKRINNLHSNLFIHMLAGKCDEMVYKTIMDGHDFNVLYEANHL